MASDVILDDNKVTVEATENVVVAAPDFELDAPSRHTGPAGPRRALVHWSNNVPNVPPTTPSGPDMLIVNFAGDYPGGVIVEGPHIHALEVRAQQLLLMNPNAASAVGGQGGHALLHSDDDALVINEGGVYSAGVRVEGTQLAVQKLRVINPNASQDTSLPGGRALAHSYDDALIVNEDGSYRGGVRVEGSHLVVRKLRVVNPNASQDTGLPGGRALAHSDDDALVINEDGSYRAGVRVDGSHLEARQLWTEQVRLINPDAVIDSGQSGGQALTHSVNDALILNNGGFYTGGVIADGARFVANELWAQQVRVVNPSASPDEGKPGGRALVHSSDDALVINEGGYYSAGVRIEGTVQAQSLQLSGLDSLVVKVPGISLPGLPPPQPIAIDVMKELMHLRAQVVELKAQVDALKKP